MIYQRFFKLNKEKELSGTQFFSRYATVEKLFF